jgi:hypothetical protein
MTFKLTYSTMFDPPEEMPPLLNSRSQVDEAIALLETSLIEAIAGQTTRREIHA